MARDIPTITVDLDKKCFECRKGGAAQSGICLECTTKALRNIKPMKSREGQTLRQRILADLKRFRTPTPESK